MGLVLAQTQGPDAPIRWSVVDDHGQEVGDIPSANVVADWKEGWLVLRVLATAKLSYTIGAEDTRAVLGAIGELGARLAGPESMFLTLDGTQNLKGKRSSEECSRNVLVSKAWVLDGRIKLAQK